ncbi:MAG: caspase family protein [Burkholderiaceae bacterium]|nr:caspase family protein [Burkholderiaceae bacterium]
MPRFAFLPAVAILLPLAAYAAPVDPVVRAGSATFAINGNVYTVTNAPNTIIDWRSFNVANGELLRFLQQNPQSVVLNRVTGNDPSQLFGLLQSNGRVVLINPNGVLFGPNAQVDVAGLIASTLNLSDADFLAGRMAFNGGAGAALNNQGRITTPLGGSVFLIGGDVTNSGVITAPGGRILLAAGQSVQLADSGTPGLSVTLKADGNQALNLGELTAQGGSIDLYGALVNHSGIARADSAVFDARGNIVLKATGDSTVSGTVSATNAAGAGGTVQVLGDSVTLTGSARIDASGQAGGGTVLVGGDVKGANAAVPNARSASVAAGAQIDASATGHGDGGKVVVWSNDKTDYAGSIFARGGALGGNGGFVETSGKQLSFDQGRVNTLAPKGAAGNWLLDPAVFCFYHTSAAECTGAAAPGATSFNTLGNLLQTTGGTLEATDFITFLPSGGNAAVSDAIPAGLTLNVKAPYIQLGNGSDVNTRAVAIRLDASNAYGTTTQTGVGGVNLTGVIDIGGHLGSTADQTLLATGDINLRHGGTSWTAVHMFAPGGTQTITAGGQILLQAGVGNDASGNPRNTALYSDGTQVINAGKLTLQGGDSAGSPNTYAEVSAMGNQSVTAGEIAVAGGLSGYASIKVPKTGMTQTINATTILLRGGSGAADNYAQLYSEGSQSINATTLDIMAGASGKSNWADISINGGTDATQAIKAATITITSGATGSSNAAGINANGTRATQTFDAGSFTMTGGGGTDNSAGVHAGGSSPTQNLTLSGALTINGGSGATGNWAHLWSSDNASAGLARQNITVGTVRLNGGSGTDAADAMIGGNAVQSVKAASISLTGGTGINGRAGITTEAAQTVSVTGALTLQGGSAASNANANMYAGGDQSISAGGAISLLGGSVGNNNNADISMRPNAGKTQTINAASIVMTGGASGDLNYAGLHAIGAGVTQNITAGSLTLNGGSGGTGKDNWAHLYANDDTVTADTGSASVHQNIKATTISLTGGASNDVLLGGNGVQTITGGSMTVTGGSGNLGTAGVNATNAQTITLDDALTLRAGNSGTDNTARLFTAGNQSITAKKSFTMTAGSGGSNNRVLISSFAAQTVDTGALVLQAGTGTNNFTRLQVFGDNATSQKVSASSIALRGGTGTSNGASISITVNGATQDITTGDLLLSAGSGGNNNNALLTAAGATTPATQRINATAIRLSGGGTADDTNNLTQITNSGVQSIKATSLEMTGGAGRTATASISNSGSGSSQSIELTGQLGLTGGSGSNASAGIFASGTQAISADAVLLTGGTGGASSWAQISRSGTAANNTLAGDQAISANRYVLKGGGGASGTSNFASISISGTGEQKLRVTNGGSMQLEGGAGNGAAASGIAFYCAGCQTSNNAADIWARGGASQVVDFVNGGSLLLKGGTVGSGNYAEIRTDVSTGAKQTITSSGGAANYPAITLTGGSGGYYSAADGSDVGNYAALGAFYQFGDAPAGALKTINAKSVALTAGGSATERGGAYLGVGAGSTVINVTGDLTVTGGAGAFSLKPPTNAAQAYVRDFGTAAGVIAAGNLDLNVGGNLIIQGGGGASGYAGIATTSSSGKLNLAVAGATRMQGNAGLAGIDTGLTMTEDLSGAAKAVVDLSGNDQFSTGTLAISGKYVGIGGIINVTSAAPDATLVGDYGGGGLNAPGWRALGAKPIVAEVFASEGIDVDDNTAINTPNGSWITVLGKNAAAAAGASQNTLTYNALASHGYQWTSAAYNAGNAQDFRFILPDNAPIVEVHADATIAQAACTTNPAQCVTQPIAAATPTSAVAPVVIEVTLTGGVDETPLSASLAQNKADTPPAAVEPAPKVQGPRVALRERETARSEQQKKSTSDLKREARDAAALAKASQDAARKAALAAQKEAAEAKRLAASTAKTEVQAVRATAAVGAAEGDLRAAEADARDARAVLGAASTPALKNQAQLRLATAEAARAGAEAKLADARAKRSELGAQGSEAGARSAQADATVLDARAREAAAEAKLADLAHKEALVRAREAKDPLSRVAAERVADDKRIEATQRAAESDVRKSLADDLRFAAEQGKAQADARQAQAQAAQALAQARRDEVRLQRALARARQEDVLTAGKGGAGRTAQGGKDSAEKLVAAESKRAEASQSAANAKAQAAEGKQRQADNGMAEVARRDATRRDRAVKAFVAGANASMTASQLAQLAALRHEYKGVLFKDALKVLEQNGRAADLPACGGMISNTCMPSFAQARMEWPTARPLVRKPIAASLPQIERKVAIVIGINQYTDPSIPQLDNAVPDADAVARQLEASMGYETRVLRNASRGEIVAALQNVARELDPNDSLVVYYAGHGYLREVPKGPAQGYWIPADGLASNPAKWISNADVSKLLANIPARQVMLVSDSCYSGAFSKEQKVGAAADPSSILARRSVVVMSSGGEEPVADDGAEGHSIFAWSLMQSLKKVGQVESGSRVFDATREQVTAAYPQVPQYGAAVSAGHAAGGDYLFETRTYK